MRTGTGWVRRITVISALATAVAAAGTASSHGVTTSRGARAGTATVTPQGWGITPAGRQTDVGPGPQAVATSPDGRMIVIANAGYLAHSLMVMNAATGRITQTIRAPGGKAKRSTWNYSAGHAHGFYVGLTFSPDSRVLYVSDGPGSSVLRYAVDGGTLRAAGTVKLASRSHAGLWPAGIATSPDGDRIYVAGNLADALVVADPATRKVIRSIPVGHL